ncbi:MAG: hypothetical protein IJT15_01695, partial [Rickettsiales bacterium]|nr:hypothetical protein [Rickettsiales bacterium]
KDIEQFNIDPKKINISYLITILKEGNFVAIKNKLDDKIRNHEQANLAYIAEGIYKSASKVGKGEYKIQGKNSKITVGDNKITITCEDGNEVIIINNKGTYLFDDTTIKNNQNQTDYNKIKSAIEVLGDIIEKEKDNAKEKGDGFNLQIKNLTEISERVNQSYAQEIARLVELSYQVKKDNAFQNGIIIGTDGNNQPIIVYRAKDGAFTFDKSKVEKGEMDLNKLSDEIAKKLNANLNAQDKDHLTFNPKANLTDNLSEQIKKQLNASIEKHRVNLKELLGDVKNNVNIEGVTLENLNVNDADVDKTYAFLNSYKLEDIDIETKLKLLHKYEEFANVPAISITSLGEKIYEACQGIDDIKGGIKDENNIISIKLEGQVLSITFKGKQYKITKSDENKFTFLKDNEPLTDKLEALSIIEALTGLIRDLQDKNKKLEKDKNEKNEEKDAKNNELQKINDELNNILRREFVKAVKLSNNIAKLKNFKIDNVAKDKDEQPLEVIIDGDENGATISIGNKNVAIDALTANNLKDFYFKQVAIEAIQKATLEYLKGQVQQLKTCYKAINGEDCKTEIKNGSIQDCQTTISSIENEIKNSLDKARGEIINIKAVLINKGFTLDQINTAIQVAYVNFDNNNDDNNKEKINSQNVVDITKAMVELERTHQLATDLAQLVIQLGFTGEQLNAVLGLNINEIENVDNFNNEGDLIQLLINQNIDQRHYESVIKNIQNATELLSLVKICNRYSINIKDIEQFNIDPKKINISYLITILKEGNFVAIKNKLDDKIRNHEQANLA